MHGGLGSAFGRSPLQRFVSPKPISRADAKERIDDLREELSSMAGEKMELGTGWRERVRSKLVLLLRKQTSKQMFLQLHFVVAAH